MEKREMTYQDLIKIQNQVVKGMRAEDLEAMLGAPEKRSDTQWVYDFKKLKGFPGPTMNAQVFTGLAADVQDGLVTNVKWGWVDIHGVQLPDNPKDQK